ncbi:hypothetical protein [Agathobaculum sp.]|nr:hypothetical protein [Agathobaculum sp.]MDY3618456.1 hypothetical protein [Agathobaculum sp.]
MLTSATPVPPGKYLLSRLGITALGALLLAAGLRSKTGVRR